MTREHKSVRELIEECRNETNIDRQIEMLYSINSKLPEHRKIRIPSLITRGFIRSALAGIEDSMLVA